MEQVAVSIVKPAREARTGMQLSDLPGGGVYVEAIDPSGLAHAAGVRLGDKILSINGEESREHEQAAAVVIAAEGKVDVVLARGMGNHRPDELGSGATLQSLGVDVASIMPAANSRTIDMSALEQIETPHVVEDEKGMNAHVLACRYCGAVILQAGIAQLMPEMKSSLPLMPHKSTVTSSSSSSADVGEQVVGFWRVGDKYDFDNVGVSRGV
ncbi:MAG: hypothetical protein SGPRY_004628, partial [Prymnesium sp.]